MKVVGKMKNGSFQVIALPLLIVGTIVACNTQTCQGFTTTTTLTPQPRPLLSAAKNSRWAIKDNLIMRKQSLSDNQSDSSSMDIRNMNELDQQTDVVVNSSPDSVFASMWKKNNKQATTMMASLSLIFALIFMYNPLPSMAAMTGGRMGGSFSSSPSRSSMSRPSGSSSYGRGYSSGFSSGYGTGYYSRPNVVITPSVVTPYYYGSPGVISYSRGPSFFDLLIFGGILFAITNMVRSSASTTYSDSGDSFSFWGEQTQSALGSGTSVVQLSVAMNVPNRDGSNSILNVLNSLSNTARTDSRVGIQNLSSQIALELLRRKDSIVSASTTYKHYNSRDQAQRDFNSRSISERSKFEQETVSKFGGVDYNAKNNAARESLPPSNDKATMAVVTMILSIDGDSTKVPKINSISDVINALQKIATDTKVDDCLQSVEILWTPESRSETLSLRDVVADYPELRSV